MTSPKPPAPAHLKWLKDTGRTLPTADGTFAKVLHLNHTGDAAVLSAWAAHFRSHYCADHEIDDLREGTGLTRAKYLEEHKFPSMHTELGPSVRAGDFGEILVADYLEYALNYWVPRTRYERKDVPDESKKGVDICGFRFVKDGQESPRDVLAMFESKTGFTDPECSDKLQKAINGSAKDETRKAFSLNALKQRLRDRNALADALRVARFQNIEDHPYREAYGAVALVSLPKILASDVRKATAKGHPARKQLALIIIRGRDMMALVHELYRRAADEA